MVKQQRYDARFVKDAWGEPLKLVKRDKKLEPALFGPALDFYEIVSSGPDRQFGTGDDVTYAQVRPLNSGWLAGTWFLDERERAAVHQQFGRFGRGDMLMLRDGMGGNNGMRFKGVPMAPGMAVPTGGAMPPMAAPHLEMATKAANGPMAQNQFKDDRRAGEDKSGAGGGGGSAPITKVREYFPETMLWQPALITDNKGRRRPGRQLRRLHHHLAAQRLGQFARRRSGRRQRSRSRSSRTSSSTSTCPSP